VETIIENDKACMKMWSHISMIYKLLFDLCIKY